MAAPLDNYTHGHADAVLRSHRWRTAANSAAYLLPHLRSGQSILDVGCGPGTLTVDLARNVAPGRVVGVDLGTEVVQEATQHATEAGVAVEFLVGDFTSVAAATAPPGGFDVVHAHQVLQHVTDPVQTLRDMASLTAPGGIVAARDADYPAMTWWPYEPALDRWLEIYMAVTKRNGAKADAGRRMLHWAEEAGLSNITYSTSTWSFSSPADLSWWTSLWADRITVTKLAEQAVAYGVSTVGELADISATWSEWGTRRGATFVVLHGEIVASPGLH